ncbi:ATK2 [Hepatospora eriocheir]|uniref:ATK2 n=1 Tax=Hepatospora eriocheir TaxID=1081669 RepID=A0A1X0Q6D3_9MICR|nr:ATK2 [Hepatospora eriocheir]
MSKDKLVPTFKLKYLEIYNETIVDLFTQKNVTIAHNSTSITFKDASEIIADNVTEIRNKIKEASNKRTVGETKCNSKSSRSHAIFILDVELKSPTEIRSGSLCLIDLAGSERLRESKAENERLKETQNINKSLSALGNVFSAIKTSENHIPFRNSKLTHLMQKYLTGHSRMAMIVNINPESLSESVCTLRFATKVSECNLGKSKKIIKIIHKE